MRGLESQPRVSREKQGLSHRRLEGLCPLPAPLRPALEKEDRERTPPAPVELGQGGGVSSHQLGAPRTQSAGHLRTCTKAKVQLIHPHFPSPATGDAHTPAQGRIQTQTPLTVPTDLHKGALWIAPCSPLAGHPSPRLLAPALCPAHKCPIFS